MKVLVADKFPEDGLAALRDRVGVLAHVFGRLKDAGINAQQTENIVFDGATAAIARIQLDQAPAAEILDGIRAGSQDVIELKLVELR